MIIYGIHSCKSAVLSGKNISRVYIQCNKDSKLIPEWIIGIKKIDILFITTTELQKLLPHNAVHQGIAMEIEDMKSSDISDLSKTNGNCIISILDGVTDPHNLGAVIRTAAAFGIKGIILPERSSCKVTSSVVKTASGGLDHIQIYIVKNISNTIEKLKTYGFWIISFCERGNKFLHEIDLSGRICLIFGAEGNGIRRLQKKNSDFIVKLPTNSVFPTLNVSASAAIAFYEVSKNQKY